MSAKSGIQVRHRESRRSGAGGHRESYFCPVPPDGGEIVITGSEARHISRVTRHEVGNIIDVVDGVGGEHRVELTAVRADRVAGRVLSDTTSAREPRHLVTIAQSVLKSDNLAQVCAQATELGISRVIPFQSARTIGRLSPARLERLRAVSLAALKSSTRTVLPTIDSPVEFDGLVRAVGTFDQALVAYEDENGAGLVSALRGDAEKFLVIVGPEGGFEPVEIDALRAAGASTVSLGPRRLRAETAAIAVVTLTLGLLGDLG